MLLVCSFDGVLFGFSCNPGEAAPFFLLFLPAGLVLRQRKFRFFAERGGFRKIQEILAGFRAFLTRKTAAAGEKDGPEAGTCDLSNPPRPYLFYYSIPRRKRGERKREIQKEFTKDDTDRRYTPRNHVS